MSELSFEDHDEAEKMQNINICKGIEEISLIKVLNLTYFQCFLIKLIS